MHKRKVVRKIKQQLFVKNQKYLLCMHGGLWISMCHLVHIQSKCHQGRV